MTNTTTSPERHNKPIRVLFIIVTMQMGGSEHLVFDLIRRLDRKKFEPYLAWIYGDTPLKQFVDLQVPLYHVPKVRRLDFGTMKNIARIVRENNIEVINAHHYLSLVYSFYGAKVVNRNGLLYTEHSVWELQVISPKWRQAGKLLLRLSDGAIGISEQVSRALADTFHLPADKVHTIPNGVDCDIFSGAKPRAETRGRLNYGSQDILIGIVANLKNNKNHIFLLRAFASLVQRDKRLRLVCIGASFADDPESSEKALLDFIAAHSLADSVALLGPRADVPDLLNALDIFCLVSYQEGLPISLIEAMASGLPVIGTDVDGIRGVIAHDTNGYLVELNNIEQLTNSLQRLIADPEKRLRFGARSREIARKHYDFDRCVSEYETLFERCASLRTGNSGKQSKN